MGIRVGGAGVRGRGANMVKGGEGTSSSSKKWVNVCVCVWGGGICPK